MAAKVIDLSSLSIPELDHLKEQVDQVTTWNCVLLLIIMICTLKVDGFVICTHHVVLYPLRYHVLQPVMRALSMIIQSDNCP